jgi:hypothetical protein
VRALPYTLGFAHTAARRSSPPDNRGFCAGGGANLIASARATQRVLVSRFHDEVTEADAPAVAVSIKAEAAC